MKKESLACLILAVVFLIASPNVVFGGHLENGASASKCILTDHEVDGLGTIETTEFILINTPNGYVILMCHFDISKELAPTVAIRNSGFLCEVVPGAAPNEQTVNSRSIVTPGGKAIMTCTINGRG